MIRFSPENVRTVWGGSVGIVFVNLIGIYRWASKPVSSYGEPVVVQLR